MTDDDRALLTRSGYTPRDDGQWNDPLVGHPVPEATALRRARADAKALVGKRPTIENVPTKLLELALAVWTHKRGSIGAEEETGYVAGTPGLCWHLCQPFYAFEDRAAFRRWHGDGIESTCDVVANRAEVATEIERRNAADASAKQRMRDVEEGKYPMIADVPTSLLVHGRDILTDAEAAPRKEGARLVDGDWILESADYSDDPTICFMHDKSMSVFASLAELVREIERRRSAQKEPAVPTDDTRRAFAQAGFTLRPAVTSAALREFREREDASNAQGELAMPATDIALWMASTYWLTDPVGRALIAEFVLAADAYVVAANGGKRLGDDYARLETARARLRTHAAGEAPRPTEPEPPSAARPPLDLAEAARAFVLALDVGALPGMLPATLDAWEVFCLTLDGAEAQAQRTAPASPPNVLDEIEAAYRALSPWATMVRVSYRREPPFEDHPGGYVADVCGEATDGESLPQSFETAALANYDAASRALLDELTALIATEEREATERAAALAAFRAKRR